MLLRSLPPDSPLAYSVLAEEEAAQKATPDEIRNRQAEWERRNAERRAREEAGL